MEQFPAFVLVSCLRIKDKSEEDQARAARLFDLSLRARLLQVYARPTEHKIRGRGAPYGLISLHRLLRRLFVVLSRKYTLIGINFVALPIPRPTTIAENLPTQIPHQDKTSGGLDTIVVED